MNERRELPIDVWAYIEDETQYWNKDFISGLPEGSKIWGCYLYDNNIDYHMASLIPAKEMWAYKCVVAGANTNPYEIVPDLVEEIEEEWRISTEVVQYVELSRKLEEGSLDYFDNPNKFVFKIHLREWTPEYKPEDTEEDREEKYIETWEDILEYYQGNHPF